DDTCPEPRVPKQRCSEHERKRGYPEERQGKRGQPRKLQGGVVAGAHVRATGTDAAKGRLRSNVVGQERGAGRQSNERRETQEEKPVSGTQGHLPNTSTTGKCHAPALFLVRAVLS